MEKRCENFRSGTRRERRGQGSAASLGFVVPARVRKSRGNPEWELHGGFFSCCRV